MALPEPGVPLSMSEIQGELGGSSPISLSEYYGVDPSLPVSGEISISDFYGLSAEVVEVRWCWTSTPASNTNADMQTGEETEFDGTIFPVSTDRFVMLMRDPYGVDAPVYSICVLDAYNGENPGLIKKQPFPVTIPSKIMPILIPKSPSLWMVAFGNIPSYPSHSYVYFYSYDGTDVTYVTNLSVPATVTGGDALQKWVPLTKDKILFKSSDRATEANSGVSKISLCVADIRDSGDIENIGGIIEIPNAGYCAIDAIDDESFVVCYAVPNGSLKVRKGTIAPDNSITLHPELVSTFTVERLFSDILTIKFGDEIRAVIGTNKYDNSEQSYLIMFNMTGDTPIGVNSMSTPLASGQYPRISEMEWDAYNSKAFVAAPFKEDINTSRLWFACISMTSSGLLSLTNNGSESNQDSMRKTPFYPSPRNRQTVTPKYRISPFYSDNAGTGGIVLLTTGVRDFSPVPPTITSTPVLDAEEGVAYTYDVDASGTAPITFSLDEYPTGMVIHSASGVITWTPDGTQVGDNSVNVRAQNAGGVDHQPFTIAVADAPSGDPEMTTAWVTTNSNGLITYDITDPANMVEIARSDSAAFGGHGSLLKITIDNASKIGFVGHAGACPCSIYTVNATDPTDGTSWDVGYVDISVEDWCKNLIQYDTANSRFYVGAGENSDPNNLLGIFDATDPTALVHITDIIDRAAYPNVDVIRNISFTPSPGYGTDLDAMDITDPLNPVILGTLTEGGAYKIANGAFDYDRNLLFFAKPGTSIPVIDITDPANMTLVTTLTGYDTGNGCAYDPASKMLLVAQGGAGDFGLSCFDMTDPLNATRTGGLASAGVMSEVRLDTVRKIAFVIGGANGTLFAVSYPDMTELAAVKIGSITPPTDPRGLALTG